MLLKIGGRIRTVVAPPELYLQLNLTLVDLARRPLRVVVMTDDARHNQRGQHDPRMPLPPSAR